MTREFKPSALKRLKDTYKSDDVILPYLQRHVMRTIGASSHSAGFMHPSDMSHKEWCGRHDYYRIVGTPVDKKGKANPSFTMENLFAEGHTIHGKYQTWLWEMGVLYGEWYCHSCANLWEGLAPKGCPRCKSLRVTYREVPLRRAGYLIEGHADGAVHDLDGWSGLIEIKSIGLGTLRFEAPRLYNRYQDGAETLENVWWKISRPFGSHVRQGQLYLWMAWPRYEWITFIYESKFHQQTKEFKVAYNPSLIAPLLETAREVTSGVSTGVVPRRPAWAEDAVSRVCVSCEYRRTCWDGLVSEDADDKKEATVQIRRSASAKRKRTLSR